MTLDKPKPKEYFIRAFNSQNQSYSCLGLRYDNSFFTAIEDTLNSRDREPSISFPVEPDFFQVFSWKSTNSLSKIFNTKELEKNKFILVEKYYKKPVDENKIQTARLHVVENTFHFSVISYENISYNTEDLDTKFIQNLKRYHIERLLAIV